MTLSGRLRRVALLLVVGLAAAGLAGCGLNVASPDVFLITRTGHGGKLTLLVNNGGFGSCNHGKLKLISSAELITARDLSDDLLTDAQNNLTIKPAANSLYDYTVAMQQGTVRFPDTAGAGHTYLAQTELFFIQTLQSLCGIHA